MNELLPPERLKALADAIREADARMDAILARATKTREDLERMKCAKN